MYQIRFKTNSTNTQNYYIVIVIKKQFSSAVNFFILRNSLQYEGSISGEKG